MKPKNDQIMFNQGQDGNLPESDVRPVQSNCSPQCGTNTVLILQILEKGGGLRQTCDQKQCYTQHVVKVY